MKHKQYKALNFDLDAHQLQAYYPGKTIDRHMKIYENFLDSTLFRTGRAPVTFPISNWEQQISMI